MSDGIDAKFLRNGKRSVECGEHKRSWHTRHGPTNALILTRDNFRQNMAIMAGLFLLLVVQFCQLMFSATAKKLDNPFVHPG